MTSICKLEAPHKTIIERRFKMECSNDVRRFRLRFRYPKEVSYLNKSDNNSYLNLVLQGANSFPKFILDDKRKHKNFRTVFTSEDVEILGIDVSQYEIEEVE